MKFGSFDGRDDGEHSGVGIVEISEIFVTLDVYSLEQSHLIEFTAILSADLPHSLESLDSLVFEDFTSGYFHAMLSPLPKYNINPIF